MKGEWQALVAPDGFGVRIIKAQHADVENSVSAAFGAPSPTNLWTPRDVAVRIHLLRDGADSLVVVVPNDTLAETNFQKHLEKIKNFKHQ
jgi:hypothetical protein